MSLQGVMRVALVVAVAAAGGLGAPLALPGRSQAPQVVINEVAWGGTAASSADEWIELYNPGPAAVDLTGWRLRAADGEPNILLSGVIPAGGYFLLERTDNDTVSDIPADQIYTGALSNSGEVLELRDAGDALVDTANGNGGGWPAGSGSPDYRSMERTDPTAPDADGNWHSNDGVHRNGLDAAGNPLNGTPKQPNSPVAPPTPTPTLAPTPTATATPTPTPTPTATETPTPYPAGVSLNEFMPDPSADWNGDGVTGDSNDEYIELYNANGFVVDVSGWYVDDAAGGSTPYQLPAGTAIGARGFLVLWSRETGIALNNSGGDSVRLLRPDGSVAEEHSYTATRPDEAYSKTVDGGAEWTRDYPPSPGASNQPAPTPTATFTATPTPTPTPTDVPPPPGTPTATPTATETPTPYPAGVSLNEYMPDPSLDWNGDGVTGDSNDEYIELYNANDFAVDVSGWYVDDAAGGSTPYQLPAGTAIGARGFLVLWSRETGIALNNSGGDSVRLLRPDGSVAEEHSYTATRPDEAYSKTVDGGTEWTRDYPPSPGASNQPAPTPTATFTATPTPTPTPTDVPPPPGTPTATPTATETPTPYPAGVSLNEFMPDPSADWNGDGVTGDSNDEYIELYNANGFVVDVSGWYVDDAAGGSTPYQLPAGTAIGARGFLVLWSRETGIALNNSGGDSVRLLRPDGSVAEEHSYTATRPDEAYSKTVDGGTEWTRDYPPSPGAPNCATTGILGGWVFEDHNRNGVYEPWLGETGIGGVLVTLSNGLSKLTGPTGFYNWRNLPPGRYTVRQAQPVHTLSTTPDEITVVLAAGDERDDISFGEVLLPPEQVRSPVALNEVLPAPRSVDWDGNGVADANDEWIELYNRSDRTVDLSGWFLDDEEGGSEPYMLPPGMAIAPRGFLVIYRAASGIALNNSGDAVRLLGPGRYELEAFPFGATSFDASWSKTEDGGTEWTRDYPPSPGASNRPAEPPPTPTPTPTSTPTPEPTPSPPGEWPDGVSLNEYMPDPSADWNGDGVTGDSNDEYIELYNANGFVVDVSGWYVDDAAGGSTPYQLPAGTAIGARGFLVLWSRETGIALNNSGGDSVRLLRPDGSVAEEHSYTATRPDEAYSKTVDGGTEWTRDYPPSPGASNQPAPTPTPTPPVEWPDGISLNEYMPDPGSDWDGDGVADAQDEYIEVYNANDFAVDLGGWMLDDVDDSAQRAYFMPEGSPVYVIPAGTVIGPRGFAVFYRSQTRIALNNEGDWVRLLRPDRAVVEAVEYTGSRKDQAHSKTVDGGTQWTRDYPPSPGASNQPAPPTPTPTPPGPLPAGVGLNEFMPRPASDWDGDGAANAQDEYIELFNASDQPVDLGGWMLDDEPEAVAAVGAAPDGTRPYVIPPGTVIPPRGFLVFYRSQTGVTLNDDGDSVRLLAPDGRELERYDYPSARSDIPYSKTEDGGNVWTTAYPPSPGAPNRPAYTEADVIRLNEVLSAPRDVDWDGDGQADYRDEWIELVNAGETTVDLGGWQLTDNPPPELMAPAAPAGRIYTLPRGLRLAPGEYLVVFRRDSGLALDAKDEWVRLLYPDGVEADRLFYDRFPGYDQAWCRIPDGVGQWTTACVETPGRPNVPDTGDGGDGGSGGAGGGFAAPYDRFNFDLIPIATARALPDGTRATLEGQVTVLPRVLDERIIYIQDATGGMQVYLRSAEWPPLSEGQWVRVNGGLDTFDGERVIRLVRIDDIKTLAPAAPPPPLPIRTGDVGEATEGRLVTITAPVRSFRGQTSLILDDGSGEAWVVVLSSTGVRRPYVVIGDVWTVVGVVSQDDRKAPYDGYYRVLPRRPADLVRGAMGWALLNSPPLFLPVTGEADKLPPPSVP